MKKIGRKFTGLALAVVMILGATVPASAASVKYTFTRGGSVFCITTTCSDFKGYVKAYAKVENNGSYTQTNRRDYKNISTSAMKLCSNGLVTRTGWYAEG